MGNRLEMLAKHVAKDLGVTIQVDKKNVCFNERTKVITLPENCILAFEDMYLAALGHEAGHLRYKSVQLEDSDWRKMIGKEDYNKAGYGIRDTLQSLHNVAEDVRINNSLGKDYPGFRDLYKIWATSCFKKWAVELSDPLSIFLATLVLKAEGIIDKLFYITKEKKIEEGMLALVEQAKKCKNSAETSILAVVLYKELLKTEALRRKDPPPQKPGSRKQSDGEAKSGNDKEKRQGGGEGKQEKGKDKKEESGGDKNSDKENTEQGQSEDADSNSGDKDSDRDGKEGNSKSTGEKESDKERQEEPQGGEGSENATPPEEFGQNCNENQKEIDNKNSEEDTVDRAVRNVEQKSCSLRSTSRYEKIEKRTRKKSELVVVDGVNERIIEKLLQKQFRKLAGRDRIDSKRLGKFGHDPEDIFRAEEKKLKPCAIHLVLDSSGSMYRDHKLDKLKVAVKEIAEAMNKIPGLYSQVISFHSRPDVVKPFNNKKIRPEQIDSIGLGGQTHLKKALEEVEKSIKKASNLRHYMIVFTDGGVNDSSNREHGRKSAEDKLKEKAFAKKTAGIIIYPGNEFAGWEMINSVRQIGSALQRALQKIVL